MYSGGIRLCLVFLVFYQLFIVSLSSSSSTAAAAAAPICTKDFKCGSFGNLSFPFTDSSLPDCGLFIANCSSSHPTTIILDRQKGWTYELLTLPYHNSIKVLDTKLKDDLQHSMCVPFFDRIRNSEAISFTVEPNITMIKCKNHTVYTTRDMEPLKGLNNYTACPDFTIYYRNPKDNDNKPPLKDIRPLPLNCERIALPMASEDSITNKTGLLGLLTAQYDLHWELSANCSDCFYAKKGSQCDGDNAYCANAGIKPVSKGKSKVGIAIGTVTGVLFIFIFCGFLVWYRKKLIKGGLHRRSKGIAELTLSKSDLEDGSAYCGIPVFSFTELEAITNNFNESNELGNGGFGTVYYGKLRDGREVAVKYLYEHNFKRMQQFKTEVEILTRLRHQNLVTLYGCTSRHSRDLLLVYEYIPNGTVADHLHGNRAKEGRRLPWPTRMNIAIETADALAYLHASDIIHRDVKSNNILLDNNFCVKVADFGLSRLFPHDVTHISTAPQGTPGYVDPEYHHCYQLTDKSDVYSFGVVLIELISSMPAVDMSRKSHDINLSSFAISRIQSCAFDELIDPSLHIESDPEVKRMTTSVAELAFRCLQNEKEMRPTMEEVVVTLREIQIYEENIGTIARETNQNDSIGSITQAAPQSPESEEVVLLRRKLNLPSSPTSVTDTWSSLSTTGTSR